MASRFELYTDGGVVGRNPSKLGGTWAWVLVDDGLMVRHGSGIVRPADLGVDLVTNNHTELYAAVRGIEAVGGSKFDGVWFTDSQVTIYRMTRRKTKYKNCPEWLVGRVKALKAGARWRWRHVGGHPTKEELARGRHDDGKEANEWNVWCDLECQRLNQLAVWS